MSARCWWIRGSKRFFGPPMRSARSLAITGSAAGGWSRVPKVSSAADAHTWPPALHLHQHREREAPLHRDEVGREPRNQRARGALVAARRRDAAVSREVRHVGLAVVVLDAERDEGRRRVIAGHLH